MILRPFFNFYGGKWRSAPRYPPPKYSRIIEPFAGSAGYSVRHHLRSITLYDADPIIFGIWNYIIKSSPKDLLRLPIDVSHVDDLSVCQEAKWLIGFWLNKGSSPSKSPSAWMRQGKHNTSFWGKEIRERIATQSEYIRHWTVINKSYEYCGNIAATWFIDPPYEKSGRLYRYWQVDRDNLSIWARTRRGQVIVCEQAGATWLPFKPFGKIKSLSGPRGKGYSKEMIWENVTQTKTSG